MKTTRTKKSPTSSSGKSTDVRPQVDTPKRSGSRIPVPLVTVDAEAGAAGDVPVTQADLDRVVTPIVDRFWALHRPGQPRFDCHNGGVILRPCLDVKRGTVGPYWAMLSFWAPRPIAFAPELPLEAMRERFPFASIRDLDEALEVLTLHELGHHACGHVSKAGLDVAQRGRMEDEADELAAVWLREGMTAANVPVNPEPLCRCFFCKPARRPRAAKRAA